MCTACLYWTTHITYQQSTSALHREVVRISIPSDLVLTYPSSHRAFFRSALDQRRAAYWSNEAVARTQYHLWAVLKAQDKDLDKAEKLYDEAKTALARLLPLDLPAGLKHVKDEEPLFDHLSTVYGGRFTGRRLLDLVR